MAHSSSSSKTWNYDVFLSFRGKDTRNTFVSHLYLALEQHNYTYLDDKAIPRGESIGQSLLTAIRESRIAIIVFSENYARSSWCLDELAYIMKCKKTRKQIVLPIFYGVEPTKVRNQSNTIGKSSVKMRLRTRELNYREKH
ncbi:hypothetical protein QVD17_31753 [Tagetes erecta]|uniref:TIR domain-containing protein n=1 Tax=Tagetes erecta TaxID=13708 RepID=A0AAD8NHA7_TARER|nr:hypothetical protein QVD17_31753 [Tagetes erecta]